MAKFICCTLGCVIKGENIEVVGLETSQTGRFGENAAAVFLRKHGYQVIAKNFSTQIGRNRKGSQIIGELDIIARDGETICFVEVKSSGVPDVLPERMVNQKKRRILNRTAVRYMELFGLKDAKHRFDIIAVSTQGQRAPAIRHLKDVWNLSD